MTPSSPEPDRRLGAAAFLGMGIGAAASLAVGVGLGVLGDRVFGTSPWLLLLGIALGAAAAVSSVVVQIRRFL